MEEVYIDIRDIDTNWFEGVRAYLDRDQDMYYFPRESAERLGELDPDSGDFLLLDGSAVAVAGEAEVDGKVVTLWSVGVTGLVTRPAEQPGRGAAPTGG